MSIRSKLSYVVQGGKKVVVVGEEEEEEEVEFANSILFLAAILA